MSNEPKTVELPEEVPAQDASKTSPEAPAREDLRAKGWSKAELDAAEKRGMIKTAEEPKKKEELDPKKVAEDVNKSPEQKKEEPSNFLDEMDKELTPAQEKVFLETFPPGTKPRAFYFRAKNERLARQRAERERDLIQLELQTRKDEDSRRAKGDPEPEADADGNVVDPEDKPLTLKQLRELQKAEREELDKRRKDMDERSGSLANALKEQEEYAKALYPDFDATVKLATDLVTNVDKIADPIKRSKTIRLIRELQITAGNADKLGLDDYNASIIAYELGQMHPEYGKKSETNGDEPKKGDPKANGGLTPEQMKRIEENTHRRASSASLPGTNGGKRTVSVGEVSVKDLLKMSPEGRYKFKKENPAEYAKLMRG